MSNGTLSILAYYAAGLAVVIALWDEENAWKRWFLVLVFFVSAFVMQSASEDEGYYRGLNESTCAVYESLEKTLPKECE